MAGATIEGQEWRSELVLSVEQVARLLRISKTTLYALLREEPARLRHFTIGKIIRITPQALIEFVNEGGAGA